MRASCLMIWPCEFFMVMAKAIKWNLKASEGKWWNSRTKNSTDGFNRLLSMGLLDYTLHHYLLLDNEFGIITESRRFQIVQYHYWEYRFQVVYGGGHREAQS